MRKLGALSSEFVNFVLEYAIKKIQQKKEGM